MKAFRPGDIVDFTTATGTELTGEVVDYDHDPIACRPRYTMRVGSAHLRATADDMTPAEQGRNKSGGAR